MGVIINVLPANAKQGLPPFVVRRADNLDQSYVVNDVYVEGGTIGECEPDSPLPGTDGRGIIWIRALPGASVFVRLDNDSDPIPVEDLWV